MNNCINCGLPRLAGEVSCPRCGAGYAEAPRSRGWFSWLDALLNGWVWPFAWIILIPAATVWWQVILFSGVVNGSNCARESAAIGVTWRCPVGDVLPTLLPGLLNLVAFLWLLSPRREVRYAALVAGALGAVRLIVPFLIYVASGPNVQINDIFFFSGPGSSVLASWGLWGLSLAVAIAFPGAVKGDQLLWPRLIWGTLIIVGVASALVLQQVLQVLDFPGLDFPGSRALWVVIALALLALLVRAIVRRLRSRRQQP